MRYVLLLFFGTAVTALGIFQLRRDLEVPRRSQWSGEPPDGIDRFRLALTIAIGAVFAALSLVALVARTVTGPAAFRATAAWLQDAFSDLTFSVPHVAVDGDLVILHVTMAGRHTGNFVTYDADGRVERVFVPTGAAFEVTQTHWQRLHEGKVIEHWANRDDQGMALQAGWVPPSPSYLFRCGRATARARRRP